MPNIGEHAENLPDSDKSHAYAVRLHPDIPNEKIAIDYLEGQKKKNKKMRSIIVDLVLQHLELGKGEDVKIKAPDAKQMMKLLREIMDRMKQGFIAQGTPQGIAASQALEGASDEFLDTFGRFADMGMDANELEYYEDED